MFSLPDLEIILGGIFTQKIIGLTIKGNVDVYYNFASKMGFGTWI